MAKQMREKKILIGIQDIIDHLGVSKSFFYKLIKIGMPAAIIDNRWYAHSENIDLFFKAITKRSAVNVRDPESIK